MENIMFSKISEFLTGGEKAVETSRNTVINLAEAETNTEYVIKEIKTDDEELKKFLFTLGCYEGETVTLISILAENYVINVKDSRYSIDKNLAEAIII
ncbi:ferrous iron transport protein A [Halanaerobacter jeridensis]|uniref:Ferrous iron transport protein A n=1 Tax=Halanaerobacter jeridensis TaxID=706427 RepID=A0A938XYJ7_9FIRM|nr:ferrous iron transport protein A [Halanaerobacter jeridensis]